MESTKGQAYDVRAYMKDRFQLTKRRYLQMTEADLHALYKRFAFIRKDVTEEKLLMVLKNSYE